LGFKATGKSLIGLPAELNARKNIVSNKHRQILSNWSHGMGMCFWGNLPSLWATFTMRRGAPVGSGGFNHSARDFSGDRRKKSHTKNFISRKNPPIALVLA